MKGKRILILTICFILVFTVACGTSVSAATVDLMDGITAQSVKGKTADEDFINSQAELYLKLYKDSFNKANSENLVISPLSVSMALSMTANGASGKTLEQMQSFLCGIDLEELNAYQQSFLNRQNNDYLKIANSIWFRDSESLTVFEPFLQTNANRYGAGIFKAPFDSSTVKDINTWVKDNTNGLIDEMVNEIDGSTIMYLINAMVFEAKWSVPYTEKPSKSVFYPASGEAQTAEMMLSNESIYLKDDNACGFIKQYEGGKYSFAALLPNKGVSINDYVNGLTAESLMNTLNNASGVSFSVRMPKFSFDCSLNMSEQLKSDIPLAFDQDNADFSALGKSDRGNIHIANVIHKTNITVDTEGTKAAASTKVEMTDKMSAMPQEEINLNRPFVFIIIDNTTKLPVFIGNLMSIN